jgi:hypothetical protein
MSHPSRFENKFLRGHGIVLVVGASTMAALTLVGRYHGVGPMSMMQAQQVGYIGFFEAFVLVAMIGLFLIVASRQEKTYPWNFLAATVHTVMAIINIAHWQFYHVLGAEMMGVMGTVFHGLWACAEGAVGRRNQAFIQGHRVAR